MGRRLSAPRIAGTYLLLLLYYGFFLIPMLWIVLQSFKTSAGIFSGLAVVAFYAFTVSWGDYLFVSIVSGSDRTATMPLYIYRISTSLQLQWGVIAVASVLTILPVVIIFAFVQRWLVEGLLAGAVKG